MFYPTQPENQRVREPITRSRGKVRGQFPSYKTGRMVAWESQLERRACYLFEFSPGVATFREQPARFYIPVHDQMRRYTPDFELVLDSGEISYVEIKPADKLKKPELKFFFEAVSGELKNSGFSFMLMTEQELIHPVRERNLTLLRRYQLQPLIQAQIQGALSWLSNAAQPFCLGSLVQQTGSITTAYSLIAQGHLWIDVEQPISAQTHIFIKEHYCENYLFTYRTVSDF